MKIDFYYWRDICPISTEIIELLNAHQGDFDIHFYDISYDRITAQKKQIFFPFLTVINDLHRFYSPITQSFVAQLLNGQIPKELPYRPQLGRRVKSATILEITAQNYDLAANCTGRVHCAGCRSKVQMYQGLNESVIGYINVENDQLLGGAEFYPSLAVPYDIPRGDDIAFITCVYLSDDNYDYKSAPLRALERYLAQFYKQVLVISDEVGVFPNGDLAFFIDNGYQKERLIFEDDYCRLHLLSKRLDC